MNTYTPNNTYHNPLSKLADGDPLNDAFINLLAKDAADNAEYAINAGQSLFKEIFHKALGGMSVGVDLAIPGAVTVTQAGRILYKNMYLDVVTQTLSGTAVNGDKIFATFTVSGKTYSGVLSRNATMPADTSTVFHLQIASVVSGAIQWSVPHTTNTSLVAEIWSQMHLPNTDTFTSAKKFYVGGPAGTGVEVVLKPTPPVDIFNFRVTSIIGTKLVNVDDINRLLVARDLVSAYSNRLKVKLAWGYEGTVQGVLTGDLFQITGVEVLDDAFMGAWVYYTESGFTLSAKVTTSGATEHGTTDLVLEDENGDPISLGTKSITGTKFATIHFNADHYEIAAVPVVGGVPQITDRVERTTDYATDHTKMETWLELEVATLYDIYIRGVKNGLPGNYIMLPAGRLLAKFPDIDSTGAALTLTQSKNGFDIAITGWDAAEKYEACFTTSGVADFANANHLTQVFSGKTCQISTNASATYSCKVRPLISGQQVGASLVGSVTSGSAGIPPNAVPIVSSYIDIRSYACVITMIHDYVGVISAVTVQMVPGTGGYSVTSLPGAVVGEVISINVSGTLIDYMIMYADGNTIQLGSMNGVTTWPSTGAHDALIAGSKRGRQILRVNKLPIDYQLIKIDFDCDAHMGEDVTLRVYQEGNEAQYDSIPTINASDSVFTNDADLIISQTHGERNLIADVWDAVAGLNRGGISGRLTIYAIPLSTSVRENSAL